MMFFFAVILARALACQPFLTKPFTPYMAYLGEIKTKVPLAKTRVRLFSFKTMQDVAPQAYLRLIICGLFTGD